MTKKPHPPTPDVGQTETGDLDIRDLRRAVQQMFFGFASLIPGSKHRQSAREHVYQTVVELNLTVRGERGEPVDNVPEVIDQALEEVKDFNVTAPVEAS